MTKLLYPLIAISRLRMSTDGEGITTLIAGDGCPLHCSWCLNKELLSESSPEPVTTEMLFDRVKIDDLYFRATGGGITFGGGEPLLHAKFIESFQKICPKGWRITVETSLAVSSEQVQTVLGVVDEFIVECKDMNPEIYNRYTGGNVAMMESNLRLLIDQVGPEHIMVRVPHIPEFNTSKDQVKSAEYLKQLGITRLDLFNYII